MITKKQYLKVGKLYHEVGCVKELIRSFESIHVAARIGIVDINSASKQSPSTSDLAAYFHNNYQEKVKDMSDDVLRMLKLRVKQINLEISQHVTLENKG